jgi:CRAL/TRIO domain
MEDCYPQLLDTLFLCNPPAIISILWKMFRGFLPKRVVQKFDMIDPLEKPKDRQKLYRHIAEDYLPAYYGGKNPKLPTEL